MENQCGLLAAYSLFDGLFGQLFWLFLHLGKGFGCLFDGLHFHLVFTAVDVHHLFVTAGVKVQLSVDALGLAGC